MNGKIVAKKLFLFVLQINVDVHQRTSEARRHSLKILESILNIP